MALISDLIEGPTQIHRTSTPTAPMAMNGLRWSSTWQPWLMSLKAIWRSTRSSTVFMPRGVCFKAIFG